jgi:hypothetical protein
VASSLFPSAIKHTAACVKVLEKKVGWYAENKKNKKVEIRNEHIYVILQEFTKLVEIGGQHG